ncbi:glutaredoxin family protein [Candidatus Symbiobacter mobilis]|uniref:Uncharacterized protein n=1 Tax=Candidatus Symbiobacter mobilis CR TaxID=946483 RepID=U5N9K6_9BURK|nr:glutaredoxin family protein [Candidatus Symbiobacter mobilis]AGX88000.1 hypothetical protein Cenrod_1922 [Candidatus Symbiobacter mobilis CR]
MDRYTSLPLPPHRMVAPWARGLWCCALVAAVCSAYPAGAQTIYRSVDAKGRVVFSDKPPADTDNAQPLDIRGAAASDAVTTTGMPFALRQAVSQYPVTLYTTKGCVPCDGGRAWLQQRGVPFSEKLVQSPEDAKMLRQLFGSVSIPMLTVGAQHLRGFSEAEWVQNIDAAGYPQESQLPPGYSNPAPVALVPPKVPVPARDAEPAQPTPATPSVAPPAGLQF